ncbi:hypothetical protein [Brevibacillus invocatus]|nr:hypothetical protein [Brevibacillus invocatus]
MASLTAEELLQAIVDPKFEENVARLISENPELEQSLEMAIRRIKSRMPLFKNPRFGKSLTEDEVLEFCANSGINMSRKNFRSNYLEKDLSKFNAAFFHEDVQAWEFDYDYISQWAPLLLHDKHELRHKIVMLVHENMKFESQEDAREELENNNAQEERITKEDVIPLLGVEMSEEEKLLHTIANPSERCVIKVRYEGLDNGTHHVYFQTTDLIKLNFVLRIDFDRAEWGSMAGAAILEMTNYQVVFDFASYITQLKKNEKLEKKFIEKILPEIKRN